MVAVNKRMLCVLALCMLMLGTFTGCSDATVSAERPDNTHPSIPTDYHVITHYGIGHFIGFVRIEGSVLYIERVELVILESIRELIETTYAYHKINYSLFEDIHTVTLEYWISMTDLGLLPDIASGSYVRNPHRTANQGVLSFKITNDTMFHFTDVQLLFGTDPNSNRAYTTNCFDEFMLFFSKNGLSTAPYFISVYNDKVLTFHELFLLTQ